MSRLGLAAIKIPLKTEIEVNEPFVLIVPTYADGTGKGAVPKQVIKFLNNPVNRSFIRGVISTGNVNFGNTYGIAGNIISKKCKVPFLYRLELRGTDIDIVNVKRGLNEFWRNQRIAE